VNALPLPERLSEDEIKRRLETPPPLLDEAERLLTPAEVAYLFRVDAKTVTRWAREGKIPFLRTLGGHRRYRESEIRALIHGTTQERES
jgi:excisionase family DNA binding protein